MVVDLPLMTYEEVARWMVELMCIQRDGKIRWIHPDYTHQVFDFTLQKGKLELLASEDVDFFLNFMSEGPGKKPVNFVPVVNGNLEYWFKKDSLWQYEEFGSCTRSGSIGRVAILQGPVAVQYHQTVDEPVSSILNNIH